MLTLNPYLNFDGKTEEAFLFYKSVFGGEFTTFQRFKETPQADQITPEEGERIMHVALPIGGSNTLMGTDTLPSIGKITTMGNNISLTLETDSKEEAETIFAKLSAEGTIDMPLTDAPWGAYFGMFSDKFGIKWMINYTYPKA
ncbi:MAG: VOC family protein [Patescibacteria group bacterium]